MARKYDLHVPVALKESQRWFAGIITSPLQENKAQSVTPRGKLLSREAKHYITPSPTMQPHERIELYNQQYWWRLLNNMQEIFPLVTRLFGFYHFNQEIAVPYLVAHPPSNWSLNALGDHLPHWVEKIYGGKDKQLIFDSVRLDLAFTHCFVAGELPSIDVNQFPSGDFSSLLKKKIYLQPHLHLFEFSYDLLAFREIFIKEEGDYWLDHDFPKLPKEKTYRFVLYRTPNNNASWKEVSRGEFYLLSLLKKGISIDKACEKLEQAEEEIVSEAMTNLQKWFQEWVMRRWICATN